jgi:adenosylcobinamide kinase/adenosylcobinamide-phosphate guanylyltransferase
MTGPDIRTTLVLGGAASGKSAYAEELVLRLPGRSIYVATAQAFDNEMTDKISAHRVRRGPEWTNLEEPLDLNGVLAEVNAPDAVILVDCLTLWLSNLLSEDRDDISETNKLLGTIINLEARVVLVSNEVGQGIVPENALARTFRSRHGLMNQSIAAAVDRVVFVAAGLPLAMKGSLE